MSIFTPTIGQDFKYGQQQPHCGLIDLDARPEIIDSALTLILNIGQGASQFLFGIYWGPVL
jgi:hypothetical protein